MPERIIEIGNQRHTKVVCVDEPSEGVCHEYEIVPASSEESSPGNRAVAYADINFQKGPIKEELNGCFDPDLVLILIDRFEHFNDKEPSRYNVEVLGYLSMALRAMRSRTEDRHARGKNECV